MDKKTTSGLLEKRIAMMTLFVASSFVFLLFVSWSTSIFYKYIGFDSSIFKAMGVFMDKGLTPYKDFFEHKGPIVVFLEYIGYGISRNDYNLLFLQSVFLGASISGVYKISMLHLSMDKSIAIALGSLPICSIFMSGQGGNTVEEWILPFLVWSTYCAVAFFKNSENEKKYKYSIVYGLTFAVAAFSRLTSAMPVVIIVIVIFIYLVKKKQWKTIWKNALYFVIGVLIITIPIFIWFMINGAFSEMMYDTFIFNLKYMAHKSFSYGWYKILKHAARYLLPMAFAAAIQIVFIVKKKDVWLSIILLTQCVVSVVMQLTGALYAHYLLVWMPTLATTLILIIRESESMKYLAKGFVTLLVIVCVGTNIIAFNKYFTVQREESKIVENRADDFTDIINKKVKDVVAINTHPYIYLYLDIVPCYKYFHSQDRHSSYDSKVYKEWWKEVESGKADYLVFDAINEYPKNKSVDENYRVRFLNDRFLILETERYANKY